MEWTAVTGAITNLTSVMETVITTIAGNAFMMVFLAVPVIGAGISVFKKLIRATR